MFSNIQNGLEPGKELQEGTRKLLAKELGREAS